jgi:hypothetical protein
MACARPASRLGVRVMAPSDRKPPPDPRPLNWLHVSTLVAVAILVGTELVGASWAAGWALGGIFQFEPAISRAFEIGFGLIGFVGLYYFMRTAIRHESIRG